MNSVDRMDSAIRVRLAREQKRALFEAARRSGTTLSDFLRRAATEAAARVVA